MENVVAIAPLFFLTALLYSMAGFGGGSTYLALLALFAFPYESLPKVALLCNLMVVSGGWWLYYRAGHFSLRPVLPFILTSIPLSFLGGTIPVGKTFFTLLLGLSLAIAGFRMLVSEKIFEIRRVLSWQRSWMVGLPAGAVLGFVSGLVGIGGGIYLSPLLLLFGWADAKQAAAACSFFILVNSIAGLGGQWIKSGFSLPLETLLPLLFAVFLGGQIGSRLGSVTLSKSILQRITASLILFVATRLLYSLY